MTIWDDWAKNPAYGQLSADPTFTAITPLFQKTWRDILFKYGDTPTADQLATGGNTGEDLTSNPYSVMANLIRAHTTNDHNSINAAANAGLEESGAAAAALNANTENYKAGQASARASEGTELGNALTNYVGQVGNIFGNLEQAPAPAAPTPVPGTPGGGPGPSAATGVGLATPQGPYTRTGAEAGWKTPISTKIRGFSGRAL